MRDEAGRKADSEAVEVGVRRCRDAEGIRVLSVIHGTNARGGVFYDAIVDAARFFLQRMKIVVEPSAATVLAALRAIASELRGKRIGMVLSGGNTDFAWLAS